MLGVQKILLLHGDKCCPFVTEAFSLTATPTDSVHRTNSLRGDGDIGCFLCCSI